jgi:hypothetical protein
MRLAGRASINKEMSKDVPTTRSQGIESGAAWYYDRNDPNGGCRHRWPRDMARPGLLGRHVPEGGHPHGKAASWVLVAVVIVAFITGGAAIIAHAWWLLWTCIGIVVLAIPAGKVVGIMDDTVAWGSTPAATHDSHPDPEADPGRPARPARR